LLETYGDSLAYFTYRSDTVGDTLATPAANARANWYGHQLGFEPVVYFDGGGAVAGETLYDEFRNRIEGARSRESLLEMPGDSLTARILTDGTAEVGVYIRPTDPQVDEMRSLMLVAVMFEDSVSHRAVGGDTAYVPIAREVAGGPWGVPVGFEFPQAFDTTFNIELGNWRDDYLGIAVFVQDTATKEVLQSVTRRRFDN
jgi:hypothetical protein